MGLFDILGIAAKSIDGPSDITLSASAEILHATEGDNDKKTREVVIDPVYSGGQMNLSGWEYPVIVDLASVKTGKRIRLLADHLADRDHLLGRIVDVQNDGRKLTAKGEIFAEVDTPAIREVLAFAAAGHEWEASIGATIKKMNFIDKGKTETINGRSISGPAYVAAKIELREISLVVFGADVGNTSAKVAAGAAQRKGHTMFEKWLEAMGLSLEDLNEVQREKLQAKFDAEQKIQDETSAGKEKKSDDVISAKLSEIERRQEIMTIAGGNQDVLLKAVSENWTVDQTRAEVELEKRKAELDAKYGTAPAIHIGGESSISADVIEAGLRLGGSERETDLEKQYKPEVLEKARGHRRMGYRELFASVLQMEGRPVPALNATEKEWIKAAFSTTSLSNILGNTANKVMMQSFNAVPSAAKLVAKKLAANDFKTHTGVRLTGDSTFKEVGEDGELKHYSLGEDTFTYSVNTYGRMIGITRQAFVNDDMNVFSGLPMQMGRGAALALERAFFTLVLANTGSFFASGNDNYNSGAGSALGDAGLTQAVKTLAEQTDTDGNPIMLNPKYLLVPPALAGTAEQLRDSNLIVVDALGSTSSKSVRPDANIHKGKYETVMSPYLSQSGFHANVSSAAWYLLADPVDMACFGIAYLNGQENPTVEEVDPDPQYLGRMWRGYLDFGVCQVEKRAGVMNAGS